MRKQKTHFEAVSESFTINERIVQFCVSIWNLNLDQNIFVCLEMLFFLIDLKAL